MDQEVTFDRASGIGGSDAAAILGISPFRSTFDVWLEKTRDPSWSPDAETARMRLGKLLEPALMMAWNQDHPDRLATPHRSGGPFTPPLWHANHIAYAHLDGILDSEGIWEGKTAATDRDWSGGVPDYYEAQVRQYLAITGEPYCELTVLFLNSARFAHYRLESSPTDHDIIEIGQRFWTEHVDPRVPPDIDGSAGAARYLAGFDRDIQAAIAAPPEIDELGQQLALVRHNGEATGAARAELENKIKEAMKDAGVGRMQGTGWSVLWKPSKGATKIGWQQVAESYRQALVQLREAMIARDDPAIVDALHLFTDENLDAIVGLYTTTGDPTHPFRFTVDGMEES